MEKTSDKQGAISPASIAGVEEPILMPIRAVLIIVRVL